MTFPHRLSDSEEQKLARHARGGNQTARETLFASQEAWVIRLVSDWHKTYGGDFEDLLQAGYVALLNAIDYFDPLQGYRLSTYLTRCVRQELIKEAKRQQRPLRHSRRKEAVGENPLIAAIQTEQRETIDAAIKQLPRRWQTIVRHRMRGLTYKQIGKALSPQISHERVRQILNRAWNRLEALLPSGL